MSYLVILVAKILWIKGCVHEILGSLIRTTGLRDLRDVEIEPAGRHDERESACCVTDGCIIANELMFEL